MLAKAIQSLLLADVDLTNDVSDRVHSNRFPQGVKATPRVLIRIHSARPLDQLDGFPTDDESRVQIDTYIKDDEGGYPVLIRVGDRIRSIFEGYQGESEGHYINGASIESDIETPESPKNSSDNWLLKRSITFRVTATNNVART